jgi:hypothetical protein
MSKLTLLPSLTASLILTPLASAVDEPTLDQRLEKLAETRERARSLSPYLAAGVRSTPGT